MDVKQGRAHHLRDTGRRVAVLVVVISCHIGLLVLVVGPAPYDPEAASGVVDSSANIALRFFRQPRLPSSHVPALPLARSMPGLQRRLILPKESAMPLTVPQAAPAATPSSEARQTSQPDIPTPYSSTVSHAGDGGFQGRLDKASPSYGASRLPGSDTPVITGIQLADPGSQGVGAVMRDAQRLFGIKSSHCIDVNTWRSLTSQELSARHISPDDVDRTDEKYACNAPPGLHF
jgi:hypothetical protein